MPNMLVEPPHIKRAKEALKEAGVFSAEANAALNLAAKLYQETTQQSRTDALRQERDLIQWELERVSEQLLLERKQTAHLADERQSPVIELQDARKIIQKLRHRVREMYQILTHPEMKPARKLDKVRFEVEAVLVKEAAISFTDVVINETLAPIIIVPQSKPTTKQKKAATTPLEVTQRRRIAELEAFLNRRSQYEKMSDRLLSKLTGIIVLPEAPLVEAAGSDPLLRDLLKRWRSLCGTVQFLLEDKSNPESVSTQNEGVMDSISDS
ncbi:hypothetical protein [Hymenobacter sp. BT559]|uniref:hypothetical protein n=1 Tax=Hymenobacter sp. BT559 TaxID=2795729 RepID=UPI0018EA3C45|nr:hypothetical protein [Hymenobacter sp. BT559]MBJ6146311.1 hypothetical protein [Hymenobacter sp. BT559]